MIGGSTQLFVLCLRHSIVTKNMIVKTTTPIIMPIYQSSNFLLLAAGAGPVVIRSCEEGTFPFSGEGDSVATLFTVAPLIIVAAGSPTSSICSLIESASRLPAIACAAVLSFAAISTSIEILSDNKRLLRDTGSMFKILTLETTTPAARARPCLKLCCFCSSNSVNVMGKPMTRDTTITGLVIGKHVPGPAKSFSMPIGHTVHNPKPTDNLYLPLSHGAQLVRLIPAYPTLQMQDVGSTLATGEIESVGQGSHGNDPGSDLYVPVSQAAHTPLSDVYPALHVQSTS
mmetsp:Transcript_13051/g.20676  ORF Transcript_13051/g.20676 Transcript_13051/m.20676 type:complete len:286 (-) Transcript_13051:3122-3979(-)